MDGIHDLGGKQGFGRIETEETEEPFHEPWEGRVRGLVNAMSPAGDWNIDWFRHCRELIAPTDYLSRPYFDQWVQTYAAMLVNSGHASVEEVASGKSSSGPVAGLKPPMSAEDVASATPGAARFDRETGTPPRFAPGDRVRARALGKTGHTRLPAYVRGHPGTIEKYHGAHLLPDRHALGEDHAEALYTVSFAASSLWPEARDSNDRVYLNLWESYLEAG